MAVLLFGTSNAVSNAVKQATRTPEDILNAVADVDPANAPDLQPGANGGATWCNKFLYLVLLKLGVELPWGTYGTRVNPLITWIGAGSDGWFPLDSAQDAQAYAMKGGIAIATYYNESGGSGHAALVLPIPGDSVQIAQAGAQNFNQGPLARGFGWINPVFYGHA